MYRPVYQVKIDIKGINNMEAVKKYIYYMTKLPPPHLYGLTLYNNNNNNNNNLLIFMAQSKLQVLSGMLYNMINVKRNLNNFKIIKLILKLFNYKVVKINS